MNCQIYPKIMYTGLVVRVEQERAEMLSHLLILMKWNSLGVSRNLSVSACRLRLWKGMSRDQTRSQQRAYRKTEVEVCAHKATNLKARVKIAEIVKDIHANETEILLLEFNKWTCCRNLF